jgi:hypothetical protein
MLVPPVLLREPAQHKSSSRCTVTRSSSRGTRRQGSCDRNDRPSSCRRSPALRRRKWWWETVPRSFPTQCAGLDIHVGDLRRAWARHADFGQARNAGLPVWRVEIDAA